MSRVRRVLSVLALVVVAWGAGYFVGLEQCPPPDWWFRLYVDDGNFACVAD